MSLHLHEVAPLLWSACAHGLLQRMCFASSACLQRVHLASCRTCAFPAARVCTAFALPSAARLLCLLLIKSFMPSALQISGRARCGLDHHNRLLRGVLRVRGHAPPATQVTSAGCSWGRP